MSHRYFGRQSVQEILSSSLLVRKVLLAQGIEKNRVLSLLNLCSQKQVPVEWVPKRILDSLVKGNHQGVVAESEAKETIDFKNFLAGIDSRFKGMVCLLDEIQDPQNLGSIVRSAVCFGWDAIILPKWRSVGVTETVMRSSSGALAHIPIVQISNLGVAIERLKEKNFLIIGSDPESKTNLEQVPWSFPLALILGNEQQGIKPTIQKNCDCLVSIPQVAKIASLNVATAASLFFYEIFKQRRFLQTC